ncbi:MAG: ATP-binding cassette domain-containing protein [Bacteroidales bacterium]|nr:ATP-binding cassette domain-containing protein [Bacteroidales bacterium]MCF8389526.1 ATP-binding cassette domain-containing protein [Bacteroidales bacterium]
MTDSMLKALMKLFAILASINKDMAKVISRNFVESFLKTQFSVKIVEDSLEIFNQEIDRLESIKSINDLKRTSLFSVKILTICNHINKELHIKNKFLILLSLIKFSKYFDEEADSNNDFKQAISDTVKTISEEISISENEYSNCKAFIVDKFYRVPEKDKLFIVSDDSDFSFEKINHFYKPDISGQVFFLKIEQADLYIFYYLGNGKLEFAGKTIHPNHVYIFAKGQSLKIEDHSSIYYIDILNGYRNKLNTRQISFVAKEIEFKFPNSDNGIHKFSFKAESGELIGIMGGSGAGKSTLLRLLSGTYTPASGSVFFNGYDIFNNDAEIKGIIGYVPQDDMLIEDLTVYENLYYNAKLCLGNLDESHIHDTVINALNRFDLFYVKDLKVGSPVNKFISGGQRKRLNIALELIIEPYLLFADEPTSGLSSFDSENVMHLLKDHANQGKIVILNIHQPSSELFKMLDKLLILDKGGYPVYLGNPLDAFSYLKRMASRVDASEIECLACGNVQTDDILNVIEAKNVDEFGEFTTERLSPPEKWYSLFLNNLQDNTISSPQKMEIPELKFKTPGVIKQFLIYSKRNLFTKLADRQFVIFALSIAPILALIIGIFTKYVSGDNQNPEAYVFSNNENLPAYIFMSVIVALFVGLIISAEEIIKDRKILSREKFLSLSRTAYLNSKILFLFCLTAIQMLIFVLIGNGILEIQNLNYSYWLVLFSTSSFAVMLGLNISSGLKSVVAIYINIPFILVPLILLSGVIVKYDKLHYKLSSTEYVPVAGDLMASRWAYEALVVNQFKNNNYEKYFNEINTESSNLLYELNFLIPAINNKIYDFKRLQDAEFGSENYLNTLNLIKNACNQMAGFDFNDYFIRGEVNSIDTDLLSKAIAKRRNFLIRETNLLSARKEDKILSILNNGMSQNDFVRLKSENYNKTIADLVLNNNELIKVKEQGTRLIRKDSPVYQYPGSDYGRAQFYSGLKRIGKWDIDTFWFNISVLWLMTLILYLSLITDFLKKITFLFDRSYKKG